MHPAPRPQFGPPCRGFTLIELLVVVAIIALLIAILLPSLARARERGRATVCLSNVRSLGLAIFIYTEDNGGYFPFGAEQGEPPRREDWIHWEANRNLRDSAVAPYSNVNANLFRCPADEWTVRPTAWDKGPYPYSYSLNLYLLKSTNNPHAANPVRHAAIRRPQALVVLIEEHQRTIDDGGWHPNYPPFPNLLSTRHDGGRERDSLRGNVAFADGHGEFLSRGDTRLPAHYDPSQ